MSLLDYLFYSVIGICVVFCVLVLLMVVIKVLMWEQKKVDDLPDAATTDPGASTAVAAAGATAAPANAPLAPGSAGDVKLYDTDPRDAAMIMAIVADELQMPLNELRFISIREVKK